VPKPHEEPTVSAVSPFDNVARFPWVTCASVVAFVICVALSFLLAGMWLARDRGGRVAIAEQTVTAEFRMTATANWLPQSPSGNLIGTSALTPSASAAVPSPTLSPTQTLPLTAAPSPTPPQQFYRLLIATHGDESLFVINLSSEPFPVDLFVVGNRRGIILGPEWGIESLPPGTCVAAWKDKGNPKAPADVDCERIGERLTRENKDRFWDDDFNIYFDKELIDECESQRCEVMIPRR
jgi:hypothetical protein